MITLLLGIISSGWTLIGAGSVSLASLGTAFLSRYFQSLVPWKLVAMLVFVVGTGVTGFVAGYRMADERAALDILRSELVFQKEQQRVQKDIAEFAQGELKKLAEKDAALEKKVTDYEEYIAKHPNNVCRATGTDVRRLRSIK